MSNISITSKPGGRVSDRTSFSFCLFIILMATLVPALIPGCSAPEPAFAEAGGPEETVTKIMLASTGVAESGIRSLDLFFFNDDQQQRLDAYQRIEGNGPSAVGASRSGKKILAVLANSPYDRYHWADVRSLEGLSEKHIHLQEEDGGRPFLSGLVRFDAGKDRTVTVDLAPRTARIELRSLRCDFRGRPYEGAALEDVRVYLTNASAACPLLDGPARAPVSFVNVGRLNPGDLEGFRDPGLVCAALPGPVGSRPVFPGIRLYCYPHAEPEDSPGSPFTRLVIEGKIRGRTCYYPLAINRGDLAGDPAGILPDRTYRFDLTFTRIGAEDPDGALEPGTLQTGLSVTDWHGQDNTVIPF